MHNFNQRNFIKSSSSVFTSDNESISFPYGKKQGPGYNKNSLESSLSTYMRGSLYSEQKHIKMPNTDIKPNRNRNISACTDNRGRANG
ncbi:MAG: hypothetical protein ACK521_08320 [bacterium]